MVNYDSPDITFDLVQNNSQGEQNAPTQYQKLSKELIESRYNTLIEQQPKLVSAKPYNMLNAMLYAASVAAFAWALLTTGDWKTDIITFVAAFGLVGTVFDFCGRWFEKYNTSACLVENIKTLSEWEYPIYVFALTHDDETVMKRELEIFNYLNDPKCTNPIHLAFSESDHKIKFTCDFGFDKGKEFDVPSGFPVLDLHPKWFLPRGIRDEKDWLDYQMEVLKIAEQVDFEFARIWTNQERNTYERIVGKQEVADDKI